MVAVEKLSASAVKTLVGFLNPPGESMDEGLNWISKKVQGTIVENMIQLVNTVDVPKVLEIQGRIKSLLSVLNQLSDKIGKHSISEDGEIEEV